MDFGLIFASVTVAVVGSVVAVILVGASFVAALGFAVRIGKKVANFFTSGDGMPLVRTASAAVPFLRYMDGRK